MMEKILNLIVWIVGVLVSLAVGGLFLDGTTMTNPILSFLPQVIHTIVGWLVIVGVLISVILAIVKAASKTAPAV